MARDEQREHALEHHEERRVVAGGHSLQSVERGAVQFQRVGGPLERLLRGSGPVERHGVDLRKVGQLPLPVGDLLFEHLAGEPLALPLRVVGVLDREWLQRVFLAAGERLVEL